MSSTRPPILWILGGILIGMLMPHLFPTYHPTKLMARQNKDSILKFGNPGPVHDLFERTAYTASYNRRDRIPYWVGEHLTAKGLSRGRGVSRKYSTFKEDQNLPEMFRAYLDDYKLSGYDRGHMAPAADAWSSQAGLDETFILTNIAPQVGAGFNQQYWSDFEIFCRGLTRNFTDVYVYTGPLFLPKVGSTYALDLSQAQRAKSKPVTFEMSYRMIGPNAVAVPTHFFKILLIPQDGKYLSGAFVLPNRAIERQTHLSQFQVDLSAVEKASGLQFFTELDRNSLLNLCEHIVCMF
ncbi:hypothetical protein BY458DRAFT_505773 [Sporodiniella umbellata]|nr:hypothetical protein BY458DRAFT_505773 [Sporodiniella umbellata]